MTDTDEQCWWSLGHRYKHLCNCVCALTRGHKGRHRCLVDVTQDDQADR